jgi:hypothetical protein
LVLRTYYLFPNLKKHPKGRKLSSAEEVTLAVDGWFAEESKEIWNGLMKVQLGGKYVFVCRVKTLFFSIP